MSQTKTAIVVTTINEPTRAMNMFADGADKHGWSFYVAGDLKTPNSAFDDFNATFLSAEDQRKIDLPYAAQTLDNHYAKKNVGYLQAMMDGAECIVESDDDNLPRDSFFEPRSREMKQQLVKNGGWVNTYRYWTDMPVWPRGFPLTLVKEDVPALGEATSAPSLLQQGLADDDPDVDAIYRLIGDLPVKFTTGTTIGLLEGSWCPFNSQNTTWFSELFPLLYLPTYCSFRMIDIWRSLVVIVILSQNDIPVVFHDATVWQERNDHNLLKDFESEVPGYLKNSEIVDHLKGLDLPKGLDNLGTALRACYQKLVDEDIFPAEELPLVDAWIASVEKIKAAQ